MEINVITKRIITMITITKTHYDFKTVVFFRVARAASVLLSDPCFQLHSIQHLLGEGEASAAGADRKHFSLHACEYTSILWLSRVHTVPGVVMLCESKVTVKGKNEQKLKTNDHLQGSHGVPMVPSVVFSRLFG